MTADRSDATDSRRWRFDGAIAGLGSAEGTRVVIGLWPASPFGRFADAMVQRSDGHRILLAPDERVAEFVSATYSFDEIRLGTVDFAVAGRQWGVTAPDLSVEFETGGRPALGRLLHAVPRPLARNRWWTAAQDPIARVVMHGVRTVGSAGGRRREYYSALDLHRIVEARIRFEGNDLGELRPVEPPVTFGFGSTPTAPGLTRITSTVVLPRP